VTETSLKSLFLGNCLAELSSPKWQILNLTKLCLVKVWKLPNPGMKILLSLLVCAPGVKVKFCPKVLWHHTMGGS